MVTGRIVHRVEWGETDPAAIIFYPNYYRWFDAATHEMFRAVGFSIASLLATGHTIALVEAHARFRSTLRYDDEITIDSRLAEVRTRTLRIEHAVRRGDAIAGDGYEVRIWVRLDPGGVIVPERIPDELRAALMGQH